MSYCTLYTFGGVPASWQLISPPRCSNPPNRSSEPVCSRGLLPRPPLSWREDKPRPHRAPHPMSLATVLLLTWPPSLGKPAWIHHMGCKVKKEMYIQNYYPDQCSTAHPGSSYLVLPPYHVPQLPSYYADSGMERSDICCWKWISHEKCWCSRCRIIGKVNASWLMVLTDLLALAIHCSSQFEFIHIQVRVYSLQSLATTYHPNNAYPQWFMHMPIIFQRHNIDRYMHPLHISQSSEFEFIWGIWSEYMMKYIQI